MSELYTISGTKFFIGPVAATTVDTAAEFAALTWTEVGMVESIPPIGDQASTVAGSVVGEGRVRKAKGARDAGDTTIVVFDDPGDTGQQAMVAAEATNFVYAFKLVYDNRLTGTGADGIDYFRGIVMSKRKRNGANDDLQRREFGIGITSAVYEVAPTAGV